VRVKTERTGKIFNLSKPLNRGGEGTIYEVPRHPNLLAKVYHRDRRNPERFRKLQIMVDYPPDDPTSDREHPSIAWPTELLRDLENDQIVGFVMPRVYRSLPLSEVYNPRARREKIPLFNYRYLVRTARNLCAAVRAVHRAGYVIGDLNESNVLVSDQALVTLVDADSFQVRDPETGVVYRSLVGKPEYTPPELQGCSFTDVDRCPEHDAFALAILIFRLLMEGFHPFDGKYQSKGEPPTIVERIRKGYFPYANSYSIIVPPPPAPPFEMLHSDIRKLFLCCFDGRHRNTSVRPRVEDWLETLERVEDALQPCTENKQHYYWGSDCPWCARKRTMRGRDAFPLLGARSSSGQFSVSISEPQHALPPIPSPTADGYQMPTQPARQRRNPATFSSFISTKQTLSFALLRTLSGHSKWVRSLSFSPDGSLLASGGADRVIRLWRISDGKILRAFTGHTGGILSVSFSPEGNLLASGSDDNTIKIWHLANGIEVRTLRDHMGSVLSVSFSPDGVLLASGSGDGTIKLWRATDGIQKRTIVENRSRILSVSFSPDGVLLASGGSGKVVKLWRVKDGIEVHTLNGHEDNVWSVSFSPDGVLLASGSGDGTIKLWRVEDGTEIRTLRGHTDVVWSVSFSPDGALLASGSGDGTVRLWRVASGVEAQTLRGHTRDVRSVVFSSDGSLIASASEDETIKLWQVC